MTRTSFSDRPNIPSPEGNASHIRLAGFEQTDDMSKVYFQGSPRDLAKALQAFDYHKAESGLHLLAYHNQEKGRLELRVKGVKASVLKELAEFIYSSTHCDMGLQITPTYLDNVKTTEEGNVRGHNYHACVNIRLADEGMAENMWFSNAIMAAILPELKSFVEEHHPGLKIARDRDMGEIMITDRQKSESQALAKIEAQEVVKDLQGLFPERARTIS